MFKIRFMLYQIKKTAIQIFFVMNYRLQFLYFFLAKIGKKIKFLGEKMSFH